MPKPKQPAARPSTSRSAGKAPAPAGVGRAGRSKTTSPVGKGAPKKSKSPIPKVPSGAPGPAVTVRPQGLADPTPVRPEPKAEPAPGPAASPVVAAAPVPAPSVVAAGRPTLLTRLVELFKLNDIEQKLVVALQGKVAAVSVAELSNELAVPLPHVLACLAPEGILRGCALVELPDSAELGWALPQDAASLGRGLHLWLAGEGAVAAASDDRVLATLPGLTSLAAPAPDVAWAQELVPNPGSERATPAIADLVREHLVAPHAVLLSLGSCSGDQVTALAQAARLRLQRPVLILDGAALAGWPLPQLVPALRRLRRDSDLRGAVLIVAEARALGAALRGLLRPRPHAQTAPLVLCSDGAPPPLWALPAGVRGEPAWTVVSQALRGATSQSPTGPAPGAASAALSREDSDPNEDPAVSASRQEARRQAAIDAARAMGRPVPKELMNAPAPPPAPATTTGGQAPTASSARPVPTATPMDGPPPGKLAAAPPAVPKAPAERPPMDAAPRRAANPRLAAALAAAGLPPVGSEQYRGGDQSAQRPAVERPAPIAPREAASAPSAPVVTVPAATAPAAPAPTPTATSPTDLSDSDDAPPLPLEAEAPVEELLRVARTTPNQAQRLELLRKLTGARHSGVIQLFRSFVTAPQPAIREAAEAGMSAIFGPNWNRSRQIAPPVQPPRSDDGGRGPGGAF